MPEPTMSFECAVLILDTTIAPVVFDAWYHDCLKRTTYGSITRQRRDEHGSGPSAPEASEGLRHVLIRDIRRWNLCVHPSATRAFDFAISHLHIP
jgi:hypothetical protein